MREPEGNTDLLTLAGIDRHQADRLVTDALSGLEDGELFLEARETESFVFDDGTLKQATFEESRGFGLRGILGEASAYAHASEITEAAIVRAGETVRSLRAGYRGALALSPSRPNASLYPSANPIEGAPIAEKIALLSAIDAYARGRDPRVRQVTCSLSGVWQRVEILRPGAGPLTDDRPLVRLNVSIVVGDGKRQESGSAGTGGRRDYGAFFDPALWQAQTDEALRQALVNLEAVPAPAGEMTVVLGAGWPGILLHEAIGHGLEGDFNRKGTSAFAGKIGTRVASRGVSVVDDGTIPGRRGSLTVDDEGTPSSRTVLIEDGILTGYIQDRLNGRLMGTGSTGNGRRESFAHAPLPRMTNTIMSAGVHDPAEIIASVPKGIYAVSFGGGQVDIASGKFVFSCTEAYEIESGKIGRPVKGATLIGHGPDCLTRVSMVGNDLALDPGIGTCGKAGQGVPVGVGQPTIRLDGITVGGTAI